MVVNTNKLEITAPKQVPAQTANDGLPNAFVRAQPGGGRLQPLLALAFSGRIGGDGVAAILGGLSGRLGWPESAAVLEALSQNGAALGYIRAYAGFRMGLAELAEQSRRSAPSAPEGHGGRVQALLGSIEAQVDGAPPGLQRLGSPALGADELERFLQELHARLREPAASRELDALSANWRARLHLQESPYGLRRLLFERLEQAHAQSAEESRRALLRLIRATTPQLGGC